MAEFALKDKSVLITVTLPDGKVLSESKANKEGTSTKFTAHTTTPYDVACVISQGLADSAVLCKVVYGTGFVADYSLQEDGMETVDTLMVDDDAADAPESDFIVDNSKDTNNSTNSNTNNTAYLWDLNRPLVGNVTRMEFLKFDSSDEAKTVFWHSSAHMLGEALEHLYGSRLTIGPPLKGGFYYDSYMGQDSIKEEDCKYYMIVYIMWQSMCTLCSDVA
jgi:threonyl-tRNA synthetase